MKKIFVLMACFSAVFLCAETLFEVKDSLDRKVLDVSTDGLRILNEGDTLMVISPSGVRVNLDNSSTKALSRTFAVTTTASKNKGLNSVLEVGTDYTTMREGFDGQRYTNFSPENIFIGLNSGQSTVPGYISPEYGVNNIFLGNHSGVMNYTGYDNILIGDSVGFNNAGGFSNIFIGNQAGLSNTNAQSSVYIGNRAGYSNTVGGGNTFIGTSAGQGNNGGNNTFVGNLCGLSSGTGSLNVFMGFRAGNYFAGAENTIIGGGAASCNLGGSDNVFIGTKSGMGPIGSTSSNSFNSIIGSEAGYQITTGGSNVIVGYQSGYSNKTGTGNVLLGNQSGYSETGSNKLYIANTSTTTPLIKGTFPNTDLTFTASNIYADGNLRIKGGTVIGKTQAGVYTVGSSTQTGVKTVTLTFPTAFTSVPKVIVTPKCANDMTNDIFVANVRNITTTNCVVMIYRVDAAGSSWGQNLQFNWIAWE
jgi:hypothetical protein